MSDPLKNQRTDTPWRVWGEDIDAAALAQMDAAVRLPVAVRGALMPDAHVGYGLPIGGVLATERAVIPYAVGVDIACRMKLSVLDLPDRYMTEQQDVLMKAIESETRFGVGAEFKRRRDHPVMDEDWSFTRLTASLKDKAWAQLGTSGSGNHFVEFGWFTLDQEDLGLPAGRYPALLSHSGSRGTGAAICSHYSALARSRHPELSGLMQHLGWLDLNDEDGQDYWQSMELMGRYASANHALIHRHIARRLGVTVRLDIENHHNFAWIERHDGRDVVVHRKGATPAGAGVVGIIPGSMAAPGFVVRGRGVDASLHSAAHGAGRTMSRTAAHKQFHWSQVKQVLSDRHVCLMSAGIDEAPMAYKDIHAVMAAQWDLIDVVARFDPAIVKMAPSGEKPED
jgi:tRNA-splicing ligase RtcB